MTMQPTPHRAINGVILPPVSETCGNCRWSKLIQVGNVECQGVPPTPVMMGVQQNLAGQPEPMMALMRARLGSTTSGCALWKERDLASAETRGVG